MSGELFKYMAKVDITHIPYRGAAPGYTDLIAGRIDMYFAVMASGLPLVEAGQVRALAVTTAKRQETAPGRAHHRRDRRARLRHVVLVRIRRAGQDAAGDHPQDERRHRRGARRARDQGQARQARRVIVGSTPEELGAHLKDEMAKWGPVIKAANIKVTD